MERRSLQLFALGYNLGDFLRRLALPRSVKHWSLTTGSANSHWCHIIKTA